MHIPTPTAAELECGYCITMTQLTRPQQHRAEVLSVLRSEIRDCPDARNNIRPWFDEQYTALATHDPIQTGPQRDGYVHQLHQRWHDEHHTVCPAATRTGTAA